MRCLIHALWSGLTVAAAGGFLFWLINAIAPKQPNGQGFLDQQEWPIHSPWAWVAVGFALGVVTRVVAFLQHQRKAMHAPETRQLAEELGLTYAGSFALPTEARSLPLFAGWLEGRDAMTETRDRKPIAIFDFTTLTRNEDGEIRTEATVALVAVEGFPAFDLRPRTLGRRLGEVLGFQGLTFDPGAVPVHTETVRRFAQTFHVTTSDSMALLKLLEKDGQAGSTGHEEMARRDESVRELFSPTLMELLNRYPSYAIQSSCGFLAILPAVGMSGSWVVPARKRIELLEAAREIRAALGSFPPRRAAEPLVPAKTGTDAVSQARKMRNSAAGGALGLVVGFCVAFGLLIHQGSTMISGLGFFLYAYVAFGCILAGGGIGALVGSRWPVRISESEPKASPARRIANGRLLKAGALVGFCGGFWCAPMLLLASIFLIFGFELGSHRGLLAAALCGSAIGGGLFGGIVGGKIVNWLFGRATGG
jgi:hypothetical protein